MTSTLKRRDNRSEIELCVSLTEPKTWSRLSEDQRREVDSWVRALAAERRRKSLEEKLKDREAEKAKLLSDYSYFYRQAWQWVDDAPLIWSWHQDVICKYLQALQEAKLFRDLVLNVPPGAGKPLSDETDVLMASGDWKRLGDIVVGDSVITKEGRSASVTEIHVQGDLECLRITFLSGAVVDSAKDHPFLTTAGWVEAGNLEVGDVCANLRGWDGGEGSDRSDDEFLIAGYFIGDGCIANNNAVLTNKDPDYIDDFVSACHRMGWRTSLSDVGTHKYISVSGGVRKWLREIGIYGCNSYTKHIPGFVFSGSDRQVAQFLRGYFHCDGNMAWKSKGRKMPVFEISSVSKGLMVGTQRLLWKLGIRSIVRKKDSKKTALMGASLRRTPNQNRDKYRSYVLSVGKEDDAYRFQSAIPIAGEKRRKLDKNRYRMPSTFQSRIAEDVVRSIEPIGKLPCRCISVSRDRSFVANGVIVSNSINSLVIFPAWCYARNPAERILSPSYDYRHVCKLSTDSKRLINSEWYQAFFGDTVQVNPKMDRADEWETLAGGWRIATTPRGRATGKHPTMILCDDPLNVRQADGNELAYVNDWWDRTMSSRGAGKALNRRRLVVMQRLHAMDLSGHILENETGWAHCCLPMRYERGRMKKVEGLPCDPRKKEGDLLWPEMFDETTVRRGERILGMDAAGQYQQRPVARTGGIFQPDKIKIVPPSAVPWGKIHYFKRAWDRAGTKNAGDYSVGVLMGIFKPHLYDPHVPEQTIIYVLDVLRGQWSTGEVQRQIELWARLDENKFGYERMETIIEQEPASSGKKVALDTIARLRGHRVRAVKPMINKIVRAEPLANAIDAYEVVMVEAPWNADFVSELRMFPRGAHDDQVDAGAMCYLEITNPNRNDLILIDTEDEDDDDIEIRLGICANRLCDHKRRRESDYCCAACEQASRVGVKLANIEHDNHCKQRHADLLNRGIWEPAGSVYLG